MEKPVNAVMFADNISAIRFTSGFLAGLLMAVVEWIRNKPAPICMSTGAGMIEGSWLVLLSWENEHWTNMTKEAKRQAIFFIRLFTC
jgi:hypothetical protein